MCPKCNKQRHVNFKEPGLASVHCSCGELLFPPKHPTTQPPTLHQQSDVQLSEEAKLKAQAIAYSDNEPSEKESLILDLLSTQQRACEQKVAEAVKAERERILTDLATIGAKIPKYSSQGWTHWIDEYVKKHGLDPVSIRARSLTNTEGEAINTTEKESEL